MTRTETLVNTAYRQYIRDELQAASRTIADDWLMRLQAVVPEDMRDIFPTEQYLDHIPVLIAEMGTLIAAPSHQVNLLNSMISRKALELGTLRHEQQATVSQLLREYDILANMLDEFVQDANRRYDRMITTDDALSLATTMNNIIRFILQSTVDKFTEQYVRTIQAQTDKLVSFNRFLGHELRTPLQSALLNAELLIESHTIAPSDRDDVLQIRTAIQTASSLISDIEHMMLSDDTQSPDSPVTQAVDLHGLVSDIAEQLDTTLSARDITLVCLPDLGALRVETGKLRLILTNLITNSIKYSASAKEDRRVEVSRAQRPDGMMALIIWDNGIGIPADKLDSVQRLRVRAHRELDDENDVSGQGIGLYLVTEAVRDLGGSIQVESEEGLYTRVTLTLPEHSSKTTLN